MICSIYRWITLSATRLCLFTSNTRTSCPAHVLQCAPAPQLRAVSATWSWTLCPLCPSFLPPLASVTTSPTAQDPSFCPVPALPTNHPLANADKPLRLLSDPCHPLKVSSFLPNPPMMFLNLCTESLLFRTLNWFHG